MGYSFSQDYCECILLRYYHLLYSLNVDQLIKVYLCAKHFYPQDIMDTQTYLDIDGKSRRRLQTSCFIEIASRVWKIFNVNTLWKGIHKRDSDSYR